MSSQPKPRVIVYFDLATRRERTVEYAIGYEDGDRGPVQRVLWTQLAMTIESLGRECTVEIRATVF